MDEYVIKKTNVCSYLFKHSTYKLHASFENHILLTISISQHINDLSFTLNLWKIRMINIPVAMLGLNYITSKNIQHFVWISSSP